VLSSNDIRQMKPRKMIWFDHVAYIAEMRNAHTILLTNRVGKRQIARPRQE
jgi:hypothetical protein